jgi:hypothetical protein
MPKRFTRSWWRISAEPEAQLNEREPVALWPSEVCKLFA